MLEQKTKELTRWGLTINGKDVFFPKKETAIKIGKLTLKMNPETKMFEEYRLWDITTRPSKMIDEQRFDRTILIRSDLKGEGVAGIVTGENWFNISKEDKDILGINL